MTQRSGFWHTRNWKRCASWGLLIGFFGLSWGGLTAQALVRPDAAGISQALRYGMENGGLGLYNLLGPNWIEAPDGTLLNVYSPFMLIASKTAQGDWPTDPTDAEIKKAKSQYERTIRNFTSLRNPVKVKFSVSLYGDAPDFAKFYTARIEGFGRGKTFHLKPDRSALDTVADEVTGGNASKPFEAINAYYFKFDDLANTDEFRLILEAPEEPPIEFRLKTERLF